MKGFVAVLSIYYSGLVQDVRGISSTERPHVSCDQINGAIIEDSVTYQALYTNPACAIDKHRCLGCKDVRQLNLCRVDQRPHCKTEYMISGEQFITSASSDKTADPSLLFPGPWKLANYNCAVPEHINPEDLKDNVSFVYKDGTLGDSVEQEDLSKWQSIDCSLQGRKFRCDGETIRMIKEQFYIVMLNATTQQPLHEVDYYSNTGNNCVFDYSRAKPTRPIPTVFPYRASYNLTWDPICVLDVEFCTHDNLTLEQAQECVDIFNAGCFLSKAEISIKTEETLPVETTLNYDGSLLKAFMPLVYIDPEIFQLGHTNRTFTIQNLSFGMDVGPVDLHVSKVFGGPLEGNVTRLNQTYSTEPVNKRVEDLPGSFIYLNKYIQEIHKVNFNATFLMELPMNEE